MSLFLYFSELDSAHWNIEKSYENYENYVVDLEEGLYTESIELAKVSSTSRR